MVFFSQCELQDDISGIIKIKNQPIIPSFLLRWHVIPKTLVSYWGYSVDIYIYMYILHTRIVSWAYISSNYIYLYIFIIPKKYIDIEHVIEMQ